MRLEGFYLISKFFVELTYFHSTLTFLITVSGCNEFDLFFSFDSSISQLQFLIQFLAFEVFVSLMLSSWITSSFKMSLIHLSKDCATILVHDFFSDEMILFITSQSFFWLLTSNTLIFSGTMQNWRQFKSSSFWIKEFIDK